MSGFEGHVSIPVDGLELEGVLVLPTTGDGLVIFAHGSGSSRKSPRNRAVAAVLQDHGLGTLLFDLLSEEEDHVYETRFDIDRLTDRLLSVTDWLAAQDTTAELSFGYFGSSTGAAGALRAAAQRPGVAAVVSRGGRVDLAAGSLADVTAPTLFIVGEADTQVLELNRRAFEELTCEKELSIVPDAGHLFEEPDQLETVAKLAAEWFETNLSRRDGPSSVRPWG